ncbi:hypothetical protein GCM10023178_41120 [Actinomadura luteofluorescens]
MEVLLGAGHLIRITRTDEEELTGDYSIEVFNAKNEPLVRQPYTLDPEGRINPIGGGDPDPHNERMRERLETLPASARKIIEDRYSDKLLDSFTTSFFNDRTDYFAAYLHKIGTVPYLLADDRQMYADEPEGTEPRINRKREQPTPAASSVALELSSAIKRTNDWLRQQLFSGAQAGSQSAEHIYREVLTHLASAGAGDSSETSFEGVRESIIELQTRTVRFAEFGLVPPISARQLTSLMDAVPATRKDLAASIIAPYVEGQNARLDSLQETEQLVRVFVSNINTFLADKKVTYSPARGLRIQTIERRPTTLSPGQLSSGERQLMLLFCNAFLARETTGLFLIDEPELSLNVKWQRRLVEALLELVHGSNVQFILATHSIEIVTRHRPYLAEVRED